MPSPSSSPSNAATLRPSTSSMVRLPLRTPTPTLLSVSSFSPLLNARARHTIHAPFPGAETLRQVSPRLGAPPRVRDGSIIHAVSVHAPYLGSHFLSSSLPCCPSPELDQALDSTYRAAVASMIQRLSNADSPTQFITTTFRPELVNVASKCYGIALQVTSVPSDLSPRAVVLPSSTHSSQCCPTR